MDRSSWEQLVDRVRADVPQLLADFLGELESHEQYRDGSLDSQDVERTALQAFTIFLDRLEFPVPAPEGAEFAERLGRRRARQGVPFAAFIEAVRINFRVLWRALERAARPDLISVLVEHGERVLTVVEWYATEVQRAYLAESESLDRQHRSFRERALSRLFSDHVSEAEVVDAASALGLSPDAEYELLAVPVRAGSLAEQPQASTGALSYEDGEYVLWFRARRGPADWPDVDPALTGAYVAHVSGVAGLRGAAILARRIADVAPLGAFDAEVTEEPGVQTLLDAFGALAAEALGDALPEFAHELLGAFPKAPDDERTRLTETVRTFLTTGSSQLTAEALFLHRNTVFKRLRQFEELTGLDVTIPRHAIVALVLLR